MQKKKPLNVLYEGMNYYKKENDSDLPRQNTGDSNA